MNHSITYRRRAPEGTTFTTVVTDGDGRAHTLLVRVGKAGSWLNAAADMAARLGGLALRHGAEPGEVAEIIRGIRHDRSGNGHEAASLPDAVAQSLAAFAEAEN